MYYRHLSLFFKYFLQFKKKTILNKTISFLFIINFNSRNLKNNFFFNKNHLFFFEIAYYLFLKLLNCSRHNVILR